MESGQDRKEDRRREFTRMKEKFQRLDSLERREENLEGREERDGWRLGKKVREGIRWKR